MVITSNYLKHTNKNPLQKFLINRFYQKLIFFVKKVKPKNILDAGCGEGFTLERIRKDRMKVKAVGVDSYLEALDLGRKIHPYINLEKGSVYKLPYKKESFDLVICSEVLEHLVNPQKASKEIARVTKKWAIFTVPHEPFFMLANLLRGRNITRLGNAPDHIRHWSQKEFEKFIKMMNWHIEKSITSFPWLLILAKK